MLSLTDIVSNDKQGSATATSMKHCNTVSAEFQNMDLQTVHEHEKAELQSFRNFEAYLKICKSSFFFISEKYINIKNGERLVQAFEPLEW